VIAVAILAFGGWSLVHYLIDSADTCMNSGPTVVLHAGPSGECVGVTDGAFQFQFGSQQQDGALHNIETLIMKEDQEVRDGGRSYVSVVYLMPAAAADSAESVATFTGQLEGSTPPRSRSTDRTTRGPTSTTSARRPSSRC
jgi:hypothetical protein